MATICILSGITINLINRSYYQTTDIWSILNSLITEPRQYGSWPHVNPSTVSESVVQSMTLSLPLLARSQHPLCERRHKPMSGVPIPASWQFKNKVKTQGRCDYSDKLEPCFYYAGVIRWIDISVRVMSNSRGYRIRPFAVLMKYGNYRKICRSPTGGCLHSRSRHTAG